MGMYAPFNKIVHNNRLHVGLKQADWVKWTCWYYIYTVPSSYLWDISNSPCTSGATEFVAALVADVFAVSIAAAWTWFSRSAFITEH